LRSRGRARLLPHIVIAVVNLPVERDRRVIRECLALEAAGYRVTVICPRGKQKLRFLPGSRHTAIRQFRQPLAGSGVVSFAMEFAWSFVCVAWKLLGLLLRGRVDAMQVCNPPDVFWPLALLMRAMRKPFVFDHHDLNPELYECKPGETNQVILGVLEAFEKLSMRCASWVVSTNESYKKIAIERGGVNPKRVTVVRNGPALSEIKAPSEAELASADGVRRIVYLGVINPQDHVDAAVLAAEQLIELRGREGWQLVVAGDGDSLPELRDLVAARGLGDVVRFTGWLGPDEVDDLLRTATIGIQPDQPTKMGHLSTMAKTVEYVGRGLPVVAADLLETRRTAEEAAVYVPTGAPAEFAKALDQLLDDEAALRDMRAVAVERFRTILAWDHQAAAYLSMWLTLVPVRKVIGLVPRDRVEVMREQAEHSGELPERTVSIGKAKIPLRDHV
jgi:glycosyltransferase involved in cell wall biosynthesis